MRTQEFVSRIWCALNDQGHEATLQVKLALLDEVPLLDFRSAEVVTDNGNRYVKISVDDERFQDWLDEYVEAKKETANEKGYLRGCVDTQENHNRH